LRELQPGVDRLFKDAYLFEFLNLPDDHSEEDLHRSLLGNLGRFLTELGRDFRYIGSEYPVHFAHLKGQCLKEAQAHGIGGQQKNPVAQFACGTDQLFNFGNGQNIRPLRSILTVLQEWELTRSEKYCSRCSGVN
jgi:hypothetical protein